MKIQILIVLLMPFSASFAQKNTDSIFVQAERFQAKLNTSYADSLSSPLLPEDLAKFKGLDFFEIDTAYCVLVKFVRTEGEIPFKMKTTTDRLPLYEKYGELHFALWGKEYVLNIYQNLQLKTKPGFEDYLFLPFTDLTNGETTYGGGRYIDFRIPASDTVVLDFNQSYNPYCVYNYKYSCPIPPSENHLDIEIRAGVKDFKKH